MTQTTLQKHLSDLIKIYPQPPFPRVWEVSILTPTFPSSSFHPRQIIYSNIPQSWHLVFNVFNVTVPITLNGIVGNTNVESTKLWHQDMHSAIIKRKTSYNMRTMDNECYDFSTCPLPLFHFPLLVSLLSFGHALSSTFSFIWYLFYPLHQIAQLYAVLSLSPSNSLHIYLSSLTCI